MERTAKTQTKKKKKITPFSVVNTVLFILISLLILIPLWKVLVDSLDAAAGYGMRLWPAKFTFGAYKMILARADLYRPFLISVLVTVAGTFVGLTLSTLGAYVLIQWEMPGRNFFSWLLLFTMLFSGGMIPTYVVMMNLHLTNTLWSVILPLGINAAIIVAIIPFMLLYPFCQDYFVQGVNVGAVKE